jgi:hypothetical protein
VMQSIYVCIYIYMNMRNFRSINMFGIKIELCVERCMHIVYYTSLLLLVTF